MISILRQWQPWPTPLASTSSDHLVRCCLAVVVLLLLPLYLLTVSSCARDTTHCCWSCCCSQKMVVGLPRLSEIENYLLSICYEVQGWFSCTFSVPGLCIWVIYQWIALVKASRFHTLYNSWNHFVGKLWRVEFGWILSIVSLRSSTFVRTYKILCTPVYNLSRIELRWGR